MKNLSPKIFAECKLLWKYKVSGLCINLLWPITFFFTVSVIQLSSICTLTSSYNDKLYFTCIAKITNFHSSIRYFFYPKLHTMEVVQVSILMITSSHSFFSEKKKCCKRKFVTGKIYVQRSRSFPQLFFQHRQNYQHLIIICQPTNV